ncbi:coiled-coil domain-containing protein [Tanacetum coccineum]
MTDVTEVGHNTAIGFVWVRRKTKSQHLFSEIGRKVSYYVEVTAFVEEGRMRNLTGVKSKELLIWVGISDIFVGDHNNGKITFGTSSGLSRTFPCETQDDLDRDELRNWTKGLKIITSETGAGDKVTDGGKDGESVGCCGEEGACGVEEGIGES